MNMDQDPRQFAGGGKLFGFFWRFFLLQKPPKRPNGSVFEAILKHYLSTWFVVDLLLVGLDYITVANTALEARKKFLLESASGSYGGP